MSFVNSYRFAAGGGGPCSFDVDAFVIATGIGGSTETAVRQLATDLGNFGICDKIVAFYPIVGGTASAHSYNLVDTTLHQVTWNGTVTHDANGCKSNGTNGWGNTGIIANTTQFVDEDGFGMGGFSKDIYTATGLNYLMGNTNGSIRVYIVPLSSTATGGTGFMPCLTTTNPAITGVVNSQGFYSSQAPTVNDASSGLPAVKYKNGLAMGTPSNNGQTQSNSVIALLGLARTAVGAPNRFFPQYATNFFISTFLDATETADLNTAVQTFETSLGR